jgi:hypothetical protein
MEGRKMAKAIPFVPAAIQCLAWGGSASGELDPGREAMDLGLQFHGAWLTAYMIRRFGPPNHGSDDHKNLCSWTLTTPVKGLALLVTPYLGNATSCCLHFGYRWSNALARQVDKACPRRKEFWKNYEVAWRWQRGKVVGMFCDESDGRELIEKTTYRAEDGAERDVGLYWARDKEVKKAYVTRADYKNMFVHCALMEAYRKLHPRKPRKAPANGRWPESAVVHRCNQALRKTIQALTQPVGVRDLAFDPINGLLGDEVRYGKKLAEPFEFSGWPCRVEK